MRQTIGRVVAAVAVAAGVIGFGVAADEKAKSTHDIMKAAFKNPGYCKKCGEAGKAGDWDAALTNGKELEATAADLPKNPTPKGAKGSKETWDKLAKQFAEQATAIRAAAEKKDADAYKTAMSAFTGACKACHDDFKKK